MAACAAYDFFNTSDDELTRIKQHNAGARYYYRTIDADSPLRFQDFFDSPSDIKKFTKKFACYTALSFLTLCDDFFQKARDGKTLPRYGIQTYNELEPKEINALERVMELFHFSLKNGSITDGWLRQLQRSAPSSGGFLFHSEIFTSQAHKLKDYKWNKLFDSELASHNFKMGVLGLGIGAGCYDSFIKVFNQQKDSGAVNLMEKLLKRVYDTLVVLYRF
jgi:hypothetical protein